MKNIINILVLTIVISGMSYSGLMAQSNKDWWNSLVPCLEKSISETRAKREGCRT
jgi:hypothetical protein